MNKRFLQITMVLLLLIIACISICNLFGTTFAENTIDYFSFFVGVFLVVEASIKILTSKKENFIHQIPRLIRIILGTCIFTIHWFQFRGM